MFSEVCDNVEAGRNENCMIRLSTFDLAMKFASLGMWNKYWDSDMFAVSLSGGRIGYCCIMGHNGQHYSLAVYIDDEGLSSLYRFVITNIGEDGIITADQTLIAHSQNCLQCYFDTMDILNHEELKETTRYFKKRGWDFGPDDYIPSLTAWRERRLPYPVNRREEEDLIAALEAAIYIGKNSDQFPYDRDNIPWNEKIPLLTKEGKSFRVSEIVMPVVERDNYIYPELPEISLIDYIRRRKKDSQKPIKVTMRVLPLYIDEPVSEEDPSHYVPIFLLVMRDGLVLKAVLSRGINSDDDKKMMNEFAELIADLDYAPADIIIDGDYGFNALEKFCEAADIRLTRVLRDEELDDAYDSLRETFLNPQEAMEDMLRIFEEDPNYQALLEEITQGMNEEEKEKVKLALLRSILEAGDDPSGD